MEACSFTILRLVENVLWFVTPVSGELIGINYTHIPRYFNWTFSRRTSLSAAATAEPHSAAAVGGGS